MPHHFLLFYIVTCCALNKGVGLLFFAEPLCAHEKATLVEGWLGSVSLFYE
tara:strand:+ start:2116 stop:2268 length:153 start_codon:yes stop_codon:yes gene_type:complete